MVHTPTQADAESRITNAVVDLVVAASGRRPRDAATLIGERSVTWIARGCMTDSEKVLVRGGASVLATAIRMTQLEEMRPAAAGAVVAECERSVATVREEVSHDPDRIICVFELEQPVDRASPPEARSESGPLAVVSWLVRFAGLPERRALAHLTRDQRTTLCGFRIPAVGDAGVESLDITRGALAADASACLVCLASDGGADASVG